MAGYGGPRKRLMQSEDTFAGAGLDGRKKPRTVDEDPGLSDRGVDFLVFTRFAKSFQTTPVPMLHVAPPGRIKGTEGKSFNFRTLIAP